MQTGKDTGLSRVEQITLFPPPSRKKRIIACAASRTAKPEHIGGPSSPPPNSHDALGIPGRQNRIIS